MKYGLILVASSILAVSCESSMIRGSEIDDNDKQLVAVENEGGAPNQQERDLQSSGNWYPVYSTWEKGVCSDATPKPNGIPSYQTAVLCCNGAYAGQTPAFCLSQTPNPPLGNPTAKPTSSPTSSPTKEFMTSVWYPDYNKNWLAGTCTNKSPLPNGRPSYDNICSCCDMAYAGQSSSKCALDGNCTSITALAGGVAYYYPSYAMEFKDGTCINTPAPPAWRNQVGSSIFIDQQTCCEAIFKGQLGNKCVAGAPTSSPVAGTSTTASKFYPNWDATNSDKGYCDNDSTLQPIGYQDGSTLFTTQAACCAAWFNFQSADGSCLKRAPSFGTIAPTATPAIVWYPKWGRALSDGRCLNDGKQGNWMTAPAYLFTDATQCCNTHFAATDNVNPAPFGISGCLLAAGLTNTPTKNPTKAPTKSPTKAPTKNPTKSPTAKPVG